jgi:hypothetical protein
MGAKKLTDTAIRNLEQLARRVPKPRGDGEAGRRPEETEFTARIVTDSTALVTGSHIRWVYTLRPCVPKAPATDGDPPEWEDLDAIMELEPGDLDVLGYNDAEMFNTATTGTVVIGTGNRVDAETGAVAGTPCILLPIGPCIVQVKLAGYYSNGDPFYRFLAISNSAEIPEAGGE